MEKLIKSDNKSAAGEIFLNLEFQNKFGGQYVNSHLEAPPSKEERHFSTRIGKPISADICRYPPISADIRRYLPIFADICRYLPIFSEIFILL